MNGKKIYINVKRCGSKSQGLHTSIVLNYKEKFNNKIDKTNRLLTKTS